MSDIGNMPCPNCGQPVGACDEIERLREELDETKDTVTKMVNRELMLLFEIGAALGHMSAVGSKVNGLIHHYRYSDHLEERIQDVVEFVAAARGQMMERREQVDKNTHNREDQADG